MVIEVNEIHLTEIQPLRKRAIHEYNFQFVHDKCYDAGWATTYIFRVETQDVGFGSVWGKEERNVKDTIFDFYIIRPFRKFSNSIFAELKFLSKASYMECQTNNGFQSEVFFENCRNIGAEAILFENHSQTDLAIPDTLFRNVSEDKTGSDYVLEHNGQIVANGGFVWNYNFPYIDMYYDVPENLRKKGYGSLFTQELKKEAYRLNKVPAARCNVTNHASKATLLKSGMRVCGHMLIGEI